MLIFSRRKDESICIGMSTTVTVLEIHGSTVTLGIDAPDGYTIWRTELHVADDLLESSLLPFNLNPDDEDSEGDCY